MDSYLMMLYVTLEQESALKNLFAEHGWEFSKPDLTVTTDRLGPSVPDAQTVNKSSNTTVSHTLTGKRKVKMKQKAPVVKMAKIVSSKIVSTVNNQITAAGVQSDTEKLDELKDTDILDTGDTDSDSTFPVNQIDSKRNEESFDLGYSPGNYDDDDDGDEDTDVDYSFEDIKEDTDLKADENETENSLTNVYLNEFENQGVNTEKQAVAETAAGPREPKARKTKKNVQKKGKKMAPKCVTCQHFEEQALILEKGPGLPDKGADEPNVFICDVCGKQFINQGTYKRHLQSHELLARAKNVRERKWNCMHCEKVYCSESNLKEHVNRVHLNKPGQFMCHLCPKSYTRSGRLQAHLNTHFGIKPFSCRSCLTAFFGKASLIEHQKKCEGGITVRFKCQFCLEYFESAEELKHHRSDHHADVFVLSPCGKKIRWKSSLKKHTATCVKCKDIETVNNIT